MLIYIILGNINKVNTIYCQPPIVKDTSIKDTCPMSVHYLEVLLYMQCILCHYAITVTTMN